MQAGAGKSEIQLPIDFLPAEGFSRQYSPLHARAVVLSGNIGVAVLSLEMTSLPDDEIHALKNLLSRETGIPYKNCFVCVTHTFSAPHILPEDILDTDDSRRKKTGLKAAIYKAAMEAACAARLNLCDVHLKLGQSECHINCSRDIETENGWWVATGGEGPSDKTLTVLCAEDYAGTPRMFIVHYAVQPSVLDGAKMSDGGKAVSGDISGVMSEELERFYPGATAVFLPGAAGDQAPVKKAKTLIRDEDGKFIEHDAGEEGLVICRELGLAMAESAQEALASAKYLGEVRMDVTFMDCAFPAQRMPRNLSELKPVSNYEYIDDGERLLSIEAFRIGPLAFLCARPELNCVTGQQIAKNSPFETTLVATMVNGGAKYMADAASYDRFTYEAMNSPFAKGAAELFAERAAVLLQELFDRQ